MKKTRKAVRGAKFREGMTVKSLKPQDDGAHGTIVKLSRKKNGWSYVVMFEGWYKLATRAEDELAEIQ